MTPESSGWTLPCQRTLVQTRRNVQEVEEVLPDQVFKGLFSPELIFNVSGGFALLNPDLGRLHRFTCCQDKFASSLGLLPSCRVFLRSRRSGRELLTSLHFRQVLSSRSRRILLIKPGLVHTVTMSSVGQLGRKRLPLVNLRVTALHSSSGSHCFGESIGQPTSE